MTREQIFAIVKKNTLEVLPDVQPDDVRIEGQLKDLGANSIDRVEIVTMSMEDLDLQIPLVELGKVSNISGLVDILHAHSQRAGS